MTEQTAPSPPSLRVLIVDDNRDTADTLSMLVQGWGFEVRTAYHGAAALEAVGEFRPEVVFSDIVMPGMDGYELAANLRKVPGLENVVLIAMTGHLSEAGKHRLTEGGFARQLIKPVEPEVVRMLLLTCRMVRDAR